MNVCLRKNCNTEYLFAILENDKHGQRSYSLRAPRLWRKLGLKLNPSTFHSASIELVSFTVVIKSKQGRKKSPPEESVKFRFL